MNTVSSPVWSTSFVQLQTQEAMEKQEPPATHHNSIHTAPRTTQPPTLRGMGNEHQPKCGDAMQLKSKGRMAYSIGG